PQDPSACTYPQRCLQSKTWVVASHAEDDGVGGQNHYTYEYADGRIDTREQQFLGFRHRGRTHVESGEIVTTEYDLDAHDLAGVWDTQGMPVFEETQTPMSTGIAHIARREITYALRTNGPAYFAFAQQIADTDGELRPDGFEPFSHRVTTRDVDEYGNVTSDDA